MTLQDPNQDHVEAEARAALEAGDRSKALSCILSAYGAEILGYLSAVARDDGTADDAYSLFCEGVWRSLERYRGESTLRSWAYGIARNSLLRTLRDRKRSAKKIDAMDADRLADIPATEPTTVTGTATSALRERVARLRAQLDESEMTLLVLRIERGMAWEEILAVMDPDAPDRAKASARLRKQFQRLRARLAKELTSNES